MPTVHKLPVVDALLAVAKSFNPKTGLVDPAVVAKLQTAADRIDGKENPIADAAAKQILACVAFDNRFEAPDVTTVLGAVRALQALKPNAGPSLPEITRALRAASIRPATVTLKDLKLSLDLTKVMDPAVTEFPSIAYITLDKPAAGKTKLDVNPDRVTVTDVIVDGKSVPFEIAKGQVVFEAGCASKVEIKSQVKPQFIKTDDDWNSATGLIVDNRKLGN